MGKNISVIICIFIISMGMAFLFAGFLDEYVSLLIVLTAMGSVIIAYLVWIVKRLKELNEIVMMLRKTSNK